MAATIPVQRLSASAQEAYRAHLLALPPNNVRLRFSAPMAAEGIAAYVARIDFDADEIFGVFADAMQLEGAAHLAFGDEFAELGVSVLPSARGRGIGHALVARATEHARNRSVRRLFMHCLAENAAMIRIARGAGMAVIVDSGEADAHLALPPMTPASLASEALADRVALYDFALKSNVEAWRRIGVALVGGKDA